MVSNNNNNQRTDYYAYYEFRLISSASSFSISINSGSSCTLESRSKVTITT